MTLFFSDAIREKLAGGVRTLFNCGVQILPPPVLALKMRTVVKSSHPVVSGLASKSFENFA